MLPRLPKSVPPDNNHDMGPNEREFYNWLLTCIAYLILKKRDFTIIDKATVFAGV